MCDSRPYVPVSTHPEDCRVEWDSIAHALRESLNSKCSIVCIECYPGVLVHDVYEPLAALLKPSLLISTEDLLLSPATLNERVAPMLTDDPVFGVMNCIEIEEFFDPEKLRHARHSIENTPQGIVLIVGTGAVKVAPHPDLLVYADMARWEIQQRQRRGEIGNLGGDNKDELPSQKYKRSFFLDWRAADRLKEQLLPIIDFVLDTNTPAEPKMISGDAMRNGLRITVQRPFRVVPFFD